MIVRAGTGWQYVMTDLSLILFMVTASALSQTADKPAPGVRAEASPQAEPLAVWRAGAGAPPVGEWLQAQSPDPRQQLTILAQYGPGGQQEALAQAEAVAGQAGELGLAARIVVEPGTDAVAASLAYDAPTLALARDLHRPMAKPIAKGTVP